MVTYERASQLARIKNIDSIELLASLDQVIELNDIWLADTLWPDTQSHYDAGWVRMTTLAEYLVFGKTLYQEFLEDLSEDGVVPPRQKDENPQIYADWARSLPMRLDGFDASFAVSATSGEIVKLRKSKGWVEKHEYKHLWRPTPEGYEMLDDCVDDSEADQATID